MIEAERALLGVVLLNPEIISLVFNEITETDFYSPHHKYIFKAMKTLHQNNKEIDYVSISAILENEKLLKQIGGIDYLNELSDSMPSPRHLETYIDLIKETSLKREIGGIVTKLSQIARSKIAPQEFLELIETNTAKLRKKLTPKFKDLKSCVSKVIKDILENHNKNNLVGVKTGFNNIDDIIGGFKPGQLNILAARTGMGKTAFMLNLAVNIAKVFQNIPKKNNILIFSLEMISEELIKRLISCESQISIKKMEQKQLTREEKLQLLQTEEKLTELNILIDDDRNTKIEEVKRKCRQLKFHQGLDIVFIDYLHLLRDDQFLNLNQAIGIITRELKKLVMELQTPIIALSQMNRATLMRESKIPNLSDLRDSGSIEQDADMVMFLHRESYYEKNQFTNDVEDFTQFIVTKNRSGKLGQCYFNFDKEIQRIEEK
ncbi:replicative DNA helicase ['Chrysanthemum coronarium' phytoplasma]|uniref:Replicative DNA helicase n=1 Tax='Chrysanthemum coronarium' phytoplasma TaxID=1520703 RepID=A0ABQ0J2K8_9MOLU|nr:replicative DNA helicase ['Chrysanthemum coronarium' phytoplasma]GAK73841.1 replicative DNA helicase ['Chrysanthemum coronarium' phytoplasma]